MHLTRIRWFDPVILQKFNTAGEWKQKESVLTFCTSARAKLVSYQPAIGRPRKRSGLKVIPLIGRSEGCALSVNGYRNGLRKVADREIKNAPRAFDSSAVRGRLTLLKADILKADITRAFACDAIPISYASQRCLDTF